MRYAKGGLVINAERDIPLLLQVRNSRFVSHAQLFEFMKFGGVDRCTKQFQLAREAARYVRAIGALPGGVLGAALPSIGSDGAGLRCSNIMANSRQCCIPILEHLPHVSQAFHSLELNRIQLGLAQANLLAGWQSEVEVASFNTISRSPYEKDYDAIVDVWVGDKRAQFALEYERTLKSVKEYERVRAALQASVKSDASST